jgi:D-beta-D-heptose 7-phosphate kinase/D-beta-D-heptose 1-phosphate adenosyltransferase
MNLNLKFEDFGPERKVLVIGDLMLDEYIIGTANRLSPEAPVPIVNMKSYETKLGGAGNVIAAVLAMGLSVDACGIIGSDGEGEMLLHLIREAGAEPAFIQRAPKTTSKVRVIANHQQLIRIDNDEIIASSEKLVHEARDAVKKANSVIISDYDKGVVTQEMFSNVCHAAKNVCPVFVDTKKDDFSFYAGCTYITPNKKEAETATGVKLDNDDNYKRAFDVIFEKTDCEAALITRGDEGMILREKSQQEMFCIPALSKDVRDVTGAGDTVIAVFASCLLVNIPIRDAAAISNIAASLAVSSVGVTVITLDELCIAVEATRRREFRPYILV